MNFFVIIPLNEISPLDKNIKQFFAEDEMNIVE